MRISYAAQFTVVSLTVVLLSSAVRAQVGDQEIVQQLLSQDANSQRRALERVRALDTERLTPEVRAALTTLLERKNKIVGELARREQALATVEDPEFIAELSRTVATLRDPRTIPALAHAIYGGITVNRALAAFGEQAIPAVVSVVRSPNTHYNAVDHGLTTLRMIVEDRQRPLSPAAVDQIRMAALQRLTGKVYFTTLWRAIDLAVALDDPELIHVVSSLAQDGKAVAARGIAEADLIERTQQRARDRLAGIPATPRRQ